MGIIILISKGDNLIADPMPWFQFTSYGEGEESP